LADEKKSQSPRPRPDSKSQEYWNLPKDEELIIHVFGEAGRPPIIEKRKVK